MTLATQMQTDLAAFFSTDDFAVSATLTHGATVTTPEVIFDNAFELANLFGFSGFETSKPFAVGKYSDFSSAAKGDTLAIAGTTYYLISNPQKGADGLTCVVQLSRDKAP
jgi:hypothetical protein